MYYLELGDNWVITNQKQIRKHLHRFNVMFSVSLLEMFSFQILLTISKYMCVSRPILSEQLSK